MIILQSRIVQLVGILNNSITDKLIILLKANLISVQVNQITLLDSLFIRIKGTSNLDKLIQDSLCKELLYMVSLINNISNNHIKIDKYQTNKLFL